MIDLGRQVVSGIQIQTAFALLHFEQGIACLLYTSILGAFGKLRQELAHYLERITTVEVIASENGKRFLYHIGTHHNGMVCSPRFGTVGRTRKSFGLSLIHILCFECMIA